MRPLFLHDFQPLIPKKIVPQQEMLDWLVMINRQCNSEVSRPQKRMDRFACKPEYITTRYSFTDDFLSQDIANLSPLVMPSTGGSLQARMDFFADISTEIFAELYSNAQQPPAEICHVSCTGYSSPSAGQKIVAQKNWDTRVTHFYHMGCYAALATVRSLARQQPEEDGIDIVHTELCTLHINPLDMSADQIVIKSLFGDGVMRYRMSPTLSAKERGFQILGDYEKIVPGTDEFMQWRPGSQQFNMVLDRRVPELIKSSIFDFLDSLCQRVDDVKLSVGDLLASAVFAIHPGGPLIIQGIEEALQLAPSQVEHSKHILKNYGNMSSATLPFVWDKIIKDKKISPGQLVASLAFGPGLSIFGNITRVVG